MIKFLPLLILIGCAHNTVCPPVIEYPAELQIKLVEELRSLPDDFTAIPWVISDYQLTREQLRVCQ